MMNRSSSADLEDRLMLIKELLKSDLRESELSTKIILRKEVIQPQVPLRLPCYDFTPVTEPTVVGCPYK